MTESELRKQLSKVKQKLKREQKLYAELLDFTFRNIDSSNVMEFCHLINLKTKMQKRTK
jgi:hypothetical protein